LRGSPTWRCASPAGLAELFIGLTGRFQSIGEYVACRDMPVILLAEWDTLHSSIKSTRPGDEEAARDGQRSRFHPLLSAELFGAYSFLLGAGMIDLRHELSQYQVKLHTA